MLAVLPTTLSSADWLVYCNRHFNTVEINNTFC